MPLGACFVHWREQVCSGYSNFHLGWEALLGMVLSCLGVTANAYWLNALEAKRVNKVDPNATNLVSIDHNGSNSDSSQEYIPKNFIIQNNSYQNTHVSSPKK